MRGAKQVEMFLDQALIFSGEVAHASMSATHDSAGDCYEVQWIYENFEFLYSVWCITYYNLIRNGIGNAPIRYTGNSKFSQIHCNLIKTLFPSLLCTSKFHFPDNSLHSGWLSLG